MREPQHFEIGSIDYRYPGIIVVTESSHGKTTTLHRS